jgi:hypothetical protein
MSSQLSQKGTMIKGEEIKKRINKKLRSKAPLLLMRRTNSQLFRS